MFKITPNPPASSHAETVAPHIADRALSHYDLGPLRNSPPESRHQEDALVTVYSILQSAAATAYENADNQTGSNRKVAMGVVHLIEMAQMWVDSVLDKSALTTDRAEVVTTGSPAYRCHYLKQYLPMILALLGLHVLTQQLVDPSLIARTLSLEPLEHISIQTDSHRLLYRHAQFGTTKEVFTQLRHIMGVDVLIFLFSQTLPISFRHSV